MGSLRDKHFSDWYGSDCILTNMATVITELQSLEEVEDWPVQESDAKAIEYLEEDDRSLPLLPIFQMAGGHCTVHTALSQMPGGHCTVETPPSPDDIPEELINAIEALQPDSPTQVLFHHMQQTFLIKRRYYE